MAMSKPIHPATVHFPMAFLSAAYALDALNPLMPVLPTILSRHLPAGPQLSQMAYYALSAGILTSIPAVMSGVSQGLKAVSSHGLKAEDGTVRPKFKTMIAHAVFNDIVVAGSAYVWYYKNQSVVTTYSPQSWMVSVQVLLGLALLWSGHLGGILTYNHGMGMKIGSSKAKGKAS